MNVPVKNKLVAIMLVATISNFFALYKTASSNPLWLSAHKLSLAAGEKINVFCAFGHAFPKSTFGLEESKPFAEDGIKFVKVISPDGTTKELKLKPKMQGKKLFLCSVKEEQAGNYLFYAENNGMYTIRTKDGGRRYQSAGEVKEGVVKGVKKSVLEKTSMKLITHVGSEGRSVESAPVGLELELVPLRNTRTLKVGEYLKVRLYCQGEPLPHAKIHFRFTGKSKISKESLEYYLTTITNKKGIARIKLYDTGTYYISSEKFIKTPTSTKHTEKRLRTVLIFPLK